MHIMPCACRWGALSRCQKLCVAGLVGAQRTVQNNSNVKSEPNTWHVKTLQYVLSTFQIFFVPLASMVADSFAFWLHSSTRFCTYSTKYLCCEGSVVLSSPSFITKKYCPDVLM